MIGTPSESGGNGGQLPFIYCRSILDVVQEKSENRENTIPSPISRRTVLGRPQTMPAVVLAVKAVTGLRDVAIGCIFNLRHTSHRRMRP